jgi:arylsulfatase A-like enzyme
MPFVSGSSARIHKEDFVSGWETCGRAAVRKGDWKMVFSKYFFSLDLLERVCLVSSEDPLKMFTVPKPKGPETWRQLYNLAKDSGEIHNLAAQEPERMQKMTKLWDQYVLETDVIPLALELGNVSHIRGVVPATPHS